MSEITVAEHAGVALLTLDRAPVNAMTIELLQMLVAATDDLMTSPPPALVVGSQPAASRRAST
jgi:enoyl-CoA hydratase/carnithine racemase